MDGFIVEMVLCVKGKMISIVDKKLKKNKKKFDNEKSL